MRLARTRSDLPPVDLYLNLSYSEAIAITLPFAEERLKLEADTGVAHNTVHIKPLSQGGTHSADNLVVMTTRDTAVKSIQDQAKATNQKELQT